jgi:hypothetical protein
MAPFKKSQWMGCISALFCATTTTASGTYICPPAIPEAGSALFQDDKLMEAVMSLTREVVKDKTKQQSIDKGCPFKDV